MLLASIVFGAVLYFFNGVPVGVGFLFIVMLLLFAWLLILTSRKDNLKSATEEDELLEEASHDPMFIKALPFC